MQDRKTVTRRLLGNFLAAFLSPLIGSSIAFNLEGLDFNVKVLLTALISASVITGIVLAEVLKK